MRKVLYILGSLDDSDIAWMARAGRRRIFRSGASLIEEGVPTPDLFILLDGQAEVVIQGVGRVAVLGSGEILGEMSFVDKAPPSATVRALDDAKVLTLNKERMENRLRESPAFAGRFYKALCFFLADRLRGTQMRQKTGGHIKAGEIEADELDENVLDGISLAGLRFQDMLRMLESGPAG